MGSVGKLLSFVRRVRNGANVSDTTADPGGGPNITAEHFAAPGDDSHPLPGDYVLLLPVRQTGRAAAAGYLDPKNEPLAAAGERRLYARDGSANVIATVWIKNTGDVVIEGPAATFEVLASGAVKADNGAGSFELQPGGDVVINNVTITPAGDITTPTKITTPSAVVNNVEVADHNHTQGNDSAGNTEFPVGPMQEP